MVIPQPESIPSPDSIVAVHKPALKMIVSRVIQRHPEVNDNVPTLKKRRKLYKGVVDLYSLTGCDRPVCQTFYVICFRRWFAESVNLQDILLANHLLSETEIITDKNSMSFIVEGTIGVSLFHGELIPFLISQFPKLRMPDGLDTEKIVDPERYAGKN